LDTLEKLWKNLTYGVFLIDAETQKIIHANDAACSLFDKERHDLVGKEYQQVISPFSKEEYSALDFDQQTYQQEHFITRGGQRVPILQTINPFQMEGKKYVLSTIIDISEAKSIEERIRKISHYDRLTGLKNRYFLDQLVSLEIERSNRYFYPVSLILLDLDHFKRINDRFGHDIGDEVLVETSRILENSIRKSDMTFRWGGEEFLILFPHLTVERASNIADGLRVRLMNHKFSTVGNVTASFGVTQYSRGETWNSWFKRTDDCLLQAKRHGRNMVIHQTNIAYDFIAKLPWKSNWESGHTLIDDDHRLLLEISNDLLKLMFTNSPARDIEPRINNLADHLKTHFKNEEDILQEIHFPELEGHCSLHQALLEEFAQCADMFLQKKASGNHLFSFLLGDLLMDHFLLEDAKYFSYTRKFQQE
jgi:diguanylate cyclase (GGDEF)-like protein/hemerythrin-like metal-binding protein/PAS domain S-box-containing protein